MTNYDKDGITCVNTGTTCTITGSKVTGIGPIGSQAQNGIEFYGIDSGAVTGTTVSGNTFTSPQYDGPGGTYYGGSGILVFEAGDLTLSKDVVNKNDVNVYAVTNQADFGPPAQGTWSITNNAITGNADWGIALFGTTASNIGGPGPGQPNTVSNNKYDGIYVGQDTYNADTNPTGLAYATVPSSGNTIANNVVKTNHADGIFAAGPFDGVQQDQGNSFDANQLTSNTRYDAEDLSNGSDTSNTANSWANDVCMPSSDSNPSGLCN